MSFSRIIAPPFRQNFQTLELGFSSNNPFHLAIVEHSLQEQQEKPFGIRLFCFCPSSQFSSINLAIVLLAAQLSRHSSLVTAQCIRAQSQTLDRNRAFQSLRPIARAVPSGCADNPTRNSSTHTTRTSPHPPGARAFSSDCASTPTHNSPTHNVCICSPFCVPFFLFRFQNS